MNYLSIEQYPKAWIFRHKDMPVSEEDLAQIKPLTDARAEQVWSQQISKECNHPENFGPADWANKNQTWLETDNWQSLWESDDPAIPELLAQHLQWEDETVVWFCYSSEHVIETSWDVFRRNWKNFLFFDDGPLLIGKKRKQVAQFHQTGNFRIGNRK
ncbi:DUF2947 domain-containing protein [Amphritea balenae]|uniref:DUF2947 family protein n=1 Tax=Amphritea balenae TaxID=452629 RepID=A0A3P1STS8_9GAMM|nr:DUF2947 domain-containing protein [Amphritea balenae]RRD00448.1 DUF2947 family protein [Amphritea balenae]GGK70733.1 hypothetical protein GCM10007941_21130 [Amphritea balenae]